MDAIEEYVRFSDVGAPYWITKTIFETQNFPVPKFDPVNGICVFTQIATQNLVLNPEFTAGTFSKSSNPMPRAPFVGVNLGQKITPYCEGSHAPRARAY